MSTHTLKHGRPNNFPPRKTKMKTLMLLLLGSAVVIGGCANPQVQLGEQMRAADEEGKREMAEIVNADKARREAYVQAHPEYREAILNRQIAVGMSAGDVTTSLAFTAPRGPNNVNTSVSAYGTHEQWVYNYVLIGQTLSRVYVYFDNGQVSSWQQSQ